MFALLGAMAAEGSAWAAKPPPITSLNDALGQLGTQGEENLLPVLKNLESACQGPYRRDVKDKPEIRARLLDLRKLKSTKFKKAVLDTWRCFAADGFLPIVQASITEDDRAVIAYGAEIASHFEDPVFVSPLLAQLERRRAECMTPGLSTEAVDACVWLAYAPSTMLGKAERIVRQIVATQIAMMMQAPYPKVREVAVETMASTRLSSFAPEIAKLIAHEKTKGFFLPPNSQALLDRFRQRQRTLEKGER
jgi:hypothetical protein